MLFDEINLRQNQLESKLYYMEQKKNIKIIFGMTVGSIMRGMQCCTSDYDLRLLYIYKDFPKKICYPNASIHRTVMEYEEIDIINGDPQVMLLETSSFLQFLIKPSIDNVCKDFGLYAMVSEMINAPYTWDPYGIQNKIAPLLSKICNPFFLLKHYLCKIKIEEGKDIVSVKDVLMNIYYVLLMEWVMRFKEFPPTYIFSLLAIVEEQKILNKIKNIIEKYKKDAKNLVQENRGVKEHESLIDTKDKDIEIYISNIIHKAELFIKTNRCEGIELSHSIIELCYEIIWKSINEE